MKEVEELGKMLVHGITLGLNNYKEITKEKAQKLKEGTEYIVYNPLTDTYRKETASINDIVHNKHCYDKLEFYLEGKDE